MHHHDYLEAGFRIFGLHGVDSEGFCTCGDENCKALFKHPRITNWQHTPLWSSEQLEVMEKAGNFDTGFGVLCDGFLVIDVDPRNGGDVNRLMKWKQKSRFVVQTGGGGWHIYFKAPKGKALLYKHENHAGVEFKTSGYVVGNGSLHASGMRYEAEKGYPQDIEEAPDDLVKMLERKAFKRTEYNGAQIDININDLKILLDHYPNSSLDYDDWITCGMILNHCTDGGDDGFKLWDEWSQRSDKYNPDLMQMKWHSFGKCANPATIGTLIYQAQKNGYKIPVTFTSDLEFDPYESSDIDLLRPVGFVGDVVSWINDQCRYPREHLAVAAALSAVSNAAGLRYKCADFGVTMNMFAFGVAGSATGKENIMQAQLELHRAAGIVNATNGNIKSEQELTRNMLRHQINPYVIDEIGILLGKIKNATKKGSASYLEGVLGLLMSSYSKADNVLPISGDLKMEVQREKKSELAAHNKKIDENEDPKGYHQRRVTAITQQLEAIETGILKPFVSLIGFTTPVTFDHLVDHESATNGFFGRALIVQEKETNPRMKKAFKKRAMPLLIENTLMALARGGQTFEEGDRIFFEKKIGIESTPEALEFLEEAAEEFHLMAEENKNTTLEAIPRRCFEQVLKVSLTLAVAEGLRSLAHCRWAYEYVKQDARQKINLAAMNMAENNGKLDEALGRRILQVLDPETPMTLKVLANRCGRYRADDVQEMVNKMARQGFLDVRKEPDKRFKDNSKIVDRVYLR